MNLLIFPDVNVWLALVVDVHIHRAGALRWWQTTSAVTVGFSRFTQIGLLRLLTTSALMLGKPLTMDGAWKAHDQLFEDNRVSFFAEPAGLDTTFRHYASGRHASPKVWADAYLAAFAKEHGGSIVTFDRGLSKLVRDSVLLAQ